MMRLDDYGVVALSGREASGYHGGDLGAAELGLAILAAVGAGFVWGYSNLGPVFNRYF
jgi:hypothetical protein